MRELYLGQEETLKIDDITIPKALMMLDQAFADAQNRMWNEASKNTAVLDVAQEKVETLSNVS